MTFWAGLIGVVAGALVGVRRKQLAPEEPQAGALWAAGTAVAVFVIASIVFALL